MKSPILGIVIYPRVLGDPIRPLGIGLTETPWFKNGMKPRRIESPVQQLVYRVMPSRTARHLMAAQSVNAPRISISTTFACVTPDDIRTDTEAASYPKLIVR